MSRTKFADLGTDKVLIRMPDGTKTKSEYQVACTVKHQGKSYELWAVCCTVSHKVVEKPKFMDFERGFKRGEIGVYLPSRRMWLFARTEKQLSEFRLLMKEWLDCFLSGNKTAFCQMIIKMAQAENRKEARKVYRRFTEKYGQWQFGFMRDSRVKGLANLLASADKFESRLTRLTKEEDGKAIPRIAWKI